MGVEILVCHTMQFFLARAPDIQGLVAVRIVDAERQVIPEWRPGIVPDLSALGTCNLGDLLIGHRYDE